MNEDMQYQEDSVRLLIQLGFTETQSKIYLTLIKTRETDAKNLAKEANISNQVTYRTLDELLAKGIVEKKLSMPNKYQAIPLEAVADMVLNAKAEQYTSALEKTKQLLAQNKKEKPDDTTNQDYSISIVEGKETIINKNRTAHANVKHNVAVCSTFQRWIQMDREINETVQTALSRGVNYRIIVERPDGDFSLPEYAKTLIVNRNFQVKVSDEKLRVNAAIFDNTYCCFSLYPSKAIAETPIIWTNQPSIIAGFQEYFKKIWKSTKNFSENKKFSNGLIFCDGKDTINYSPISI